MKWLSVIFAVLAAQVSANVVPDACAAPAPSSSATKTPTAPDCEPTLVIDGAATGAFNKANSPVVFKPSCGSLNTEKGTYAVFKQGPGGQEPLKEFGMLLSYAVVKPDGIHVQQGFDEGQVGLTIIARSDNGSPIMQTFTLLFGAIDMPVQVIDENGKPAAGINVTADSVAYFGSSSELTTNDQGIVVFKNLPETSIGLVARSTDNKLAFTGVAPTTETQVLKLMPLSPVSLNTDFHTNNGTTGWVFESPKEVPVLDKRDSGFVLGTNGLKGISTGHAEPKVYKYTKTVHLKYRFITSEVPGGYFGTKYNDFYVVSIRSNMGDQTLDANSMNGLGLGSFDGDGATQFFDLQLPVHEDTTWVEFDIGVANVADGLFDSAIEVESIGDLKCDQCGSCETCPGNPTCQPTCQDPPRMTCDFYSRCAEPTLKCGSHGYAIRYGQKHCHGFSYWASKFSDQGQKWIWDTMKCLQNSLVQPLIQCGTTCSSFEAAAFDSHPKCYAESGVCFLPVLDYIKVGLVVRGDLFEGPARKQAEGTLLLCAKKYAPIVEAVLVELAKQAADDAIHYAEKALYEAAREWLRPHTSL
ncbi:hypothetical protein NLG97_g3409 [Lecanicillium saksenae]|uniref:Uncharacterized protein n=1 Tax=Lecanicillium saksenae TaxID=468837 RepID=A0ACC1R0W4_9HYPO|nr:hypothetical protein NLG97_g3409 [Lecanicillium saksenae]